MRDNCRSRIARLRLGLVLLVLSAAWAGRASSADPAPRGPRQGLFVANFGGSISEFQGKVKSGPFPPHRNLISHAIVDGQPSGVAFDNNRNLWNANKVGLLDGHSGTITEFSRATLNNLKNNSAPAPDVTISDDEHTLDVLNCPQGLTFDSSGNLWVAAESNANCNVGVIDEYTPAQIARSGAPDPNIRLVPKSFAFSFPKDMKFGPGSKRSPGNLFVDDGFFLNQFKGIGQINVYTAAQIAGLAAGANSVDPGAIIASHQFNLPLAEGFDSSGNLWVANCNKNEVLEFNKSRIPTSGTVDLTPDVILGAVTIPSPPATAASTQSFECPDGIAFMSNGDLIVSNFFSDECGSLAWFRKSDIASSGSPTPRTFVDSDPNCDNLRLPIRPTLGLGIR